MFCNAREACVNPPKSYGEDAAEAHVCVEATAATVALAEMKARREVMRIRFGRMAAVL